MVEQLAAEQIAIAARAALGAAAAKEEEDDEDEDDDSEDEEEDTGPWTEYDAGQCLPASASIWNNSYRSCRYLCNLLVQCLID